MRGKSKRPIRRRVLHALIAVACVLELCVLPHYFHLLDARYCPVPGVIVVRFGPLAQTPEIRRRALEPSRLRAALRGPAPTQARLPMNEASDSLFLEVSPGEECRIGQELVRELPNVFAEFELSIRSGNSGEYLSGCDSGTSNRPYLLTLLALTLLSEEAAFPKRRHSTFREGQLREPEHRRIECADIENDDGLWPLWSF